VIVIFSLIEESFQSLAIFAKNEVFIISPKIKLKKKFFFYFKELYMSAKVVAVSDAEFEQTVLKSDKPVMLDFWAEWCQPCKMLTPTVEELAGDFDGQILVGKLNVDDNPNTATTYGIRGIPTLLFIKDGKVVQQVVGVKSKAEIKKVIEENLLA
jgi:thioredoxin 1